MIKDEDFQFNPESNDLKNKIKTKFKFSKINFLKKQGKNIDIDKYLLEPDNIQSSML